MSDRLAAVKAQFDAMIERMKEEFGRQVDREMEVLMEMWREEKRRVKNAKMRPSRARTGKRVKKDKVAEGGHQSDDNEDSVSVKSKIESDECGCTSNEEDYSNFEVKAESSEEDATAPIASTSRGKKRQATSARKEVAKKRRITQPVDNQDQDLARGPGNRKMQIISIDCTVADCQRTFRCVHKMREHLLAAHQVHPFPCRAQGCDQQFDKIGEFGHHTATHPRATTIWICPHCPHKTFHTSGKRIGKHITKYHQTGRFMCAVGQCHLTFTTRYKVNTHRQVHQRMHTSTITFHCTFVDCGYKGKRRDVVGHIRTVHFRIPRTLKAQRRRGIIDHRDPNEYIEVDEEAQARR